MTKYIKFPDRNSYQSSYNGQGSHKKKKKQEGPLPKNIIKLAERLGLELSVGKQGDRQYVFANLKGNNKRDTCLGMLQFVKDKGANIEEYLLEVKEKLNKPLSDTK